jgi:hypothetical protein
MFVYQTVTNNSEQPRITAWCPGRPLTSPQPSKEDTTATQIVMDHTGDTRHQFDPADAAAVAEAEERFKMLTGAGFTTSKRLGASKSEASRVSARPDGRGDAVHSAAQGRMIWVELFVELGVALMIVGASIIVAVMTAQRKPAASPQADADAPPRVAFPQAGRAVRLLQAFRGDRIRHRRALPHQVWHGHERRLDSSGKTIAQLCFAPQGHLVVGDVLLAQKIAPETMESEAPAAAKTPTTSECRQGAPHASCRLP